MLHTDIKLLLWDIANYLTKNKTIDLKKFNEFAIKNNIQPKKIKNEIDYNDRKN